MELQELESFLVSRHDAGLLIDPIHLDRWSRNNGEIPEYAEFDTSDPHYEIAEALEACGFYEGVRAEFQIRVWRDRAVYIADADRQSRGQGHREYGTDLQVVIERLFAVIDGMN